MRTPVKTHLPSEEAPLEWAVTADGVLYTAHVPLRADGSIEDGPIERQAEVTFDNLKRTLEAAGGSLDDVTQVLVYLTDPAVFPGHERRLSPLLRQALSEPRHRDRGRPDGAGCPDRDRGLRPPQSPLNAHPMRVVVIGAGLIGMTTAWYLAERGHAVTVLDRNPHRARGRASPMAA